jgi:hypothetical protein
LIASFISCFFGFSHGATVFGDAGAFIGGGQGMLLPIMIKLDDIIIKMDRIEGLLSNQSRELK